MSWRLVQSLEATPRPEGQPRLTTTEIVRFYYPLALTSVLSLITLPVITFFMGHSRQPIESLAVLPVINAFVFLFRSGAFAYQEVAVALTGLHREHEPEVRRVSRTLGLVGSGLLALVALTPLADVWFQTISGLTPEMTAFALGPIRILMLMPALEYLLQTQRAFLILSRRTRFVTIGTGVEAAVIALALFAGVAGFDLVGAMAAALATIVGRLGANLFFHRALHATASHT
jgi:O-antigen/teichoic acid export membrane protein